ncbi:MAG: glycoside hydrolase family 127 protein [Verrucomicrobia bacterium]|nr:glycoside hydrolase family 127 protein [Verrucomicrobiota bacterium]
MAGKNDKVDLLSFPGERYEVEVPDTLDLTERAALAINAMTRVVVPEKDYEMCFITEFRDDPPKLYLEWDGIFNTGKFLEALPLMRVMTGSDFNAEVDAKIMESYLHGAGPDGLFYCQVENRPWSYYAEWNAAEEISSIRGPYGFFFGEGRLILAMCMWYEHDHDPRWKPLIEKKIDRLLAMGYKQDDTIAFSRLFEPGKNVMEAPESNWDNWVPYGVTKYHQLTGYEPAGEFARLQVNYLRKHWFTEDGRFRVWHLHLTLAALTEILEYAIATNDQELIELARNGYEFGKALGEPLIGFFPEVRRKSFPTCESCGVGDMIYLAIRLTEIGAGDYWEDADRYIRNHFVESQLTRMDWVDPHQLAALQSDEWKEAASRRKTMIAEGQLYGVEEDALERSLGSWAGWTFANDAGNPNRPGIMQCCTANAARSLYYAWNAIVTPEEDGVRVNLLLNRASPWLDVDSHLPYEGKVVLRNKTAKNVSVRIPEGIPQKHVTCNVNGKTQETVWAGGYLAVGGLKKGDVVTIEFPIEERSLFRVIGDVPYKLALKGNTVVDINPEGTLYPLYQRDHYRTGKAPMKRVTRFVFAKTSRQ